MGELEVCEVAFSLVVLAVGVPEAVVGMPEAVVGMPETVGIEIPKELQSLSAASRVSGEHRN